MTVMSATIDRSGATPAEQRLIGIDMMAGDERVPALPPIPRARYVSPEFHRAEIEHIFRKSWLLLGHVCEFERKGSYRLVDLPFGPVILMRGDGDEMRAFLNSCPHRGATVLKEPTGCARVMSCQYHGWTYNLEGRLIGMPNAEAFPDLDRSEFALPRLRCEQWGGFIYVNFNPEAEPLLEALGTVVDANPQVEDIPGKPMRLLFRKSWDIDCNWKLLCENFNEGYHIDFVHGPSLTNWCDQTKLKFELHRSGGVTQYNFYRSLDEMSWEGSPQKMAVPDMPAMLSRPEFDARHAAIFTFPNMLLITAKQFYNPILFLPLAPGRCRLETTIYVSDWGTGPKPEDWNGVVLGVESVTQEDLELLPQVQKSIEAAPDTQVRMGGFEIPIYHINAAIDRRIGAANIPAGCALPVPGHLDPWIAR